MSSTIGAAENRPAPVTAMERFSQRANGTRSDLAAISTRLWGVRARLFGGPDHPPPSTEAPGNKPHALPNGQVETLDIHFNDIAELMNDIARSLESLEGFA